MAEEKQSKPFAPKVERCHPGHEARENERRTASSLSPVPSIKERIAAAIEGRIPHPEETPEPLPARMLNEFVYCPRLFYYEHVEGVFRESEDTLRGSSLHARVDSGSGALPPAKKRRQKAKVQERDAGSPQPASKELHDDAASTEPETIHARSVTLASDELGVVAKMDLIEARRDPDDLFSPLEVQPVDYKLGSPREGEDGPEIWDTDRMQLGLQCLILRHNGYACPGGVLYYRGTKQRVALALTTELESWVREQIDTARKCAVASEIPPPLENSPKCVRCSLAPICLPDETAYLENLPPDEEEVPVDENESVPVRRLMAARDERRALYLSTPGLYLGLKSERLEIRDKDKKSLDSVRLSDVTHVALMGPIQISTRAVQVLCQRGVPVTFHSSGGYFYGIAQGHALPNIRYRIAQFEAAADPLRSLRLAQAFVEGKIRNQRTLLRRNHLQPPPDVLRQLKRHHQQAGQAADLNELLGREGAAAALYFGAFAGMFKTSDPVELEEDSAPDAELIRFDFQKRNRRPPRDPVNALLSLGYSILARDCTIAATAVGLDPYRGFFHQPRAGRPGLALDLMEEFRPLIVDSAVLTLLNNRMLSPADFVQAGAAVNLTAAGRRTFFHAYEQRINAVVTHPVFDYKVSYRRALELQVRLLARVLTGEIPRYIPFVTR